MDVDDLEMATNVSAVIGTYSNDSKYSFECEDGRYGKYDGDYYLAVKYDDVKESAKPASMMSAKWISRSVWDLTWVGLKQSPQTKAELHSPRSGDWAFLRITQGG